MVRPLIFHASLSLKSFLRLRMHFPICIHHSGKHVAAFRDCIRSRRPSAEHDSAREVLARGTPCSSASLVARRSSCDPTTAASAVSSCRCMRSCCCFLLLWQKQKPSECRIRETDACHLLKSQNSQSSSSKVILRQRERQDRVICLPPPPTPLSLAQKHIFQSILRTTSPHPLLPL